MKEYTLTYLSKKDKTPLFIVLIAFLVYFISWAFVYKAGINKLSIQSEDVLPALFVPQVILTNRTLYLDTYVEMMLEKYPHPDDKNYEEGLTPFYLRKVISHQGTVHYLSAFTIITPLLVIPFYIVFNLFGGVVSWDSLAVMSHLGGAFILSLSGGLFYILLKERFLDAGKALLVTAVFLFGTINFSLISQALWQHGTLQLFYILSLIFLYKSLENSPEIKISASIWFGFFYALALLSRPTGLIAAPIFVVLIIIYLKKDIYRLGKYTISSISGFIAPIIFFLWYNNKYYFSLFNQGYADQAGTGWLSNMLEGFLGLWLSPSKGILVYSPVLLFALWGVYIAIKRNIDKRLDYILFFSLVLLHTLVLGKWKHWYGGWSYGYRMASDILPFLTLLLVPFFQSSYFEKYKKMFYFLFVTSILIQIHGIIFFDGIWHAAYDMGFENTGWLWSIQDSEFAFNLRRFFVKIGILDRACPNCLPG